MQCGDGSRLLSVVRDIHKHAESHNQRAREELMSKEGNARTRINQVALEVQFGAFSDHFVVSVPDWFGGRILNKASQCD
jgi:hypothetical protein